MQVNIIFCMYLQYTETVRTIGMEGEVICDVSDVTQHVLLQNCAREMQIGNCPDLIYQLAYQKPEQPFKKLWLTSRDREIGFLYLHPESPTARLPP